ncbi:hypothetical protein HDU93_004505 [Gonapodya sp. JEL0774]|nr:hypothetical protein HDU93_004505 [Gonapodya sp. JEL0774]
MTSVFIGVPNTNSSSFRVFFFGPLSANQERVRISFLILVNNNAPPEIVLPDVSPVLDIGIRIPTTPVPPCGEDFVLPMSWWIFDAESAPLYFGATVENAGGPNATTAATGLGPVWLHLNDSTQGILIGKPPTESCKSLHILRQRISVSVTDPAGSQTLFWMTIDVGPPLPKTTTMTTTTVPATTVVEWVDPTAAVDSTSSSGATDGENKTGGDSGTGGGTKSGGSTSGSGGGALVPALWTVVTIFILGLLCAGVGLYICLRRRRQGAAAAYGSARSLTSDSTLFGGENGKDELAASQAMRAYARRPAQYLSGAPSTSVLVLPAAAASTPSRPRHLHRMADQGRSAPSGSSTMSSMYADTTAPPADLARARSSHSIASAAHSERLAREPPRDYRRSSTAPNIVSFGAASPPALASMPAPNPVALGLATPPMDRQMRSVQAEGSRPRSTMRSSGEDTRQPSHKPSPHGSKRSVPLATPSSRTGPAPSTSSTPLLQTEESPEESFSPHLLPAPPAAPKSSGASTSSKSAAGETLNNSPASTESSPTYGFESDATSSGPSSHRVTAHVDAAFYSDVSMVPPSATDNEGYSYVARALPSWLTLTPTPDGDSLIMWGMPKARDVGISKVEVLRCKETPAGRVGEIVGVVVVDVVPGDGQGQGDEGSDHAESVDGENA